MLSAYTMFLDAAAQLRQAHGVDLSASDEHLLHHLARQWLQGATPAITQMMQSVPGLSPSSVQRGLTRLHKRGWIDFRACTRDARRRLVIPSQQTRDYFERLRQAMHHAVQLDIAGAAAPPRGHARAVAPGQA